MNKKSINTVENTSQTAQENPMLGLVMALPGGIEASEARGQRQLVESSVLPTDIRDPYEDGKLLKGATRSLMESWGFVFGEVVSGDPMFQNVQLPAGWKKKGSSHAMWSSVVDDKGRERLSIFYKAAFYDRSAFMGIVSRYKVDTEPQDPANKYKTSAWRGIVKEGDTVLFTSEWRTPEKDR